ncbi:mitotic checkpoint regulator, MAD2B-interacting-domain-containing protein [Aspergillus desertorum]
MVLVAYSDSEASDSEHEHSTPAAPTSVAKPAPDSQNAPSVSAPKITSIVDKSNPRKIRIALPDIKPETPGGGGEEDGPARKKPRVGGGGGGAFGGFNSLLPAPKRPNATVEKDKKLAGGGTTRKVFSLKTAAAPGFDREADEEMRRDMAFGSSGGGGGGDDGDDDETIPKAGSLRANEDTEVTDVAKKKKPEKVVLKGNPMMFKPLSVARAGQKKKKSVIPPPLPASKPRTSAIGEMKEADVQPDAQMQELTAPPVSKPKVSLFSLSASTEEAAVPVTSASAHASTYEPLVYTANVEALAAGSSPEIEPAPAASAQPPPSAQTLDYIADDLNLSRSQRRQLFGRNADPSSSKVLHFNTDAEYAANQEMAHKELAATQHNPVRAIAPGKHTLQQLVNAASTQKEALEESFASGKRNKKEAGAKYGW